jgi:hypothetical protein
MTIALDLIEVIPLEKPNTNFKHLFPESTFIMTSIYINSRYAQELGLPYFFEDGDTQTRFLWAAEFLGSRFGNLDSEHRDFYLNNAGKRLQISPNHAQGPGWWSVERALY